MFLDVRKMLRIFFFALIIWLYTCLAALQKEAVQTCDHLDKEKAFKVCWMYNESSNIINFALEVSTLGWVGFGFAHKIHRMQDYDVIVGKIQSGKESLTDRFTNGYREPLADLSQDYTLTGFNESNGKTFLEFHRKRDTGDKRDIEIKPGPMLLVYAYHSLDYPSPYRTKHEKQGSKPVTVIPADPDKLVKPTGGVTEDSITPQSTQALTKLSSSANRNTVGDPDQRSASSNACVSVLQALMFSSCNLIFTASTSNFFFG